MAVQIAGIISNRLHVDHQALGKILDKVGDHPVAVITVSGPFHTGKSSIINRLFRQLTVHQDSEGRSQQIAMVEELWKHAADQPNEIQAWPEPLISDHNGQSTAVLLMFVHGNLDGTITTLDNALIFTLGCLLSSVLIYHVENDLSEDMLQFLQLTIANAKAVSCQENWNPFAKLLFVINGWQSPDVYSYGYHDDSSLTTMRNIKKEKLDLLTGINPENRVVRQEIMYGFQEVGCCLVPKFGDGMVQGEGPLDHLGSWIFREGRSIRKAVQGREVTGYQLKALVQMWQRSLGISKISALRNQVEVHIAMALSVVLSFFRVELTNAINGSGLLSNDQLFAIHAQKKQEAVAMFERLTMAEPQADLRVHVDMLMAEFDNRLGTFLQVYEEKKLHPPPPYMPATYVATESPGLAAKRSNRSCIIATVVCVKLLLIVIYLVIKFRTSA